MTTTKTNKLAARLLDTAYTYTTLTINDLIADGWNECAAWEALGRPLENDSPRYFVHRANDEALGREGVLQYAIRSGTARDIGGGCRVYDTEAEAIAAVADEAARVKEVLAEEAAAEAAWDALPDAEKARQAEQFALEAAIARVPRVVVCRVTPTTDAAIRAAAKARGESVSHWLKFSALTAPTLLPPETEPAPGETLSEIIQVQLSLGARRDFGIAAYKAGVGPSDYLRRAIAARLAGAHAVPTTSTNQT